MAKKLEKLADKAYYPIYVKTNKQNFKVGELLQITCQPDREGYLNVLNINPQDKQIFRKGFMPREKQDEKGFVAGKISIFIEK